MSNFPNSKDDDVTLPRVDDNITEIGGEAINALRDVIFALEDEIGVISDGYSAKGSRDSIAVRLGISLEDDGTIKSSAIAGLGLVTLPIDNSQISPTAAIAETKLALAYSTSDLYNFINNFNTSLNVVRNFISASGSKFEPHLSGTTYRHQLTSIDVSSIALNYFKDKEGNVRNNTNLYTLMDGINDEFVAHQKADSTLLSSDPTSVSTGTIPPDNYAHVAAGIYLNPSDFSFFPQTTTSLQKFAQFIDSSNIFILGTRIQTLYGNGIPRSARAASLTVADAGTNIIPYTLATTYLLNGGSSSPVEDIDAGDDIILFTPESGVTNHSFDALFSAIKPGDVATVDYGNSVSASFVIKEKKYAVSGVDKTYALRINGKNLYAVSTAQVKVDKSLYNTDKQGVASLAIAPSPTSSILPSLIVGAPRGAEVLGVGFNPELLDVSHHKLYLQLYPTGNPSDSVISLAAIDVTGNSGATPGAYTLESIVDAMNTQFRTPGYNYRFTAFAYKGEIGLMLADSVANTSFSIISGIVNSLGVYSETLSNIVYPSNVVNLFDGKDGLGFGTSNANLASPAYAATYSTAAASQVPTKIFTPLAKKTYYVNGAEKERFNVEPEQSTDGYGDGYWDATITAKTILAGSRVRVTYQVNKDLTTSSLKPGKTILVQEASSAGSVVDFGRFTIESVQFSTCACDGYDSYASITVYDAVHSTGNTPYLSSNIGTAVRLYFSGDSVSFSEQNASDTSSFTSYKRSFEVYVDQDGKTFTHERARMNISGTPVTVNDVELVGDAAVTAINIDSVSPKLRGYGFEGLTKITLSLENFDSLTGVFDGYLCSYDGSNATSVGPTIVGKKGSFVRFYDETNIDYIDFIFNAADTITSFSTPKFIDIQLFPSLMLNESAMLLGTCQLNNVTNKVTNLRDRRDFGNTSEKHLTTSALDYISAPTKLLSDNGIIRGFDITGIPSGSTPYLNTISVTGGIAVVNGKIIQVNNNTVAVPAVREVLSTAFTVTNNTITWFLCVNDKAELEMIASTDFLVSDTSYVTAGVDHTRMFYVKNPNLPSQGAYPVRATYLNDLVLNQKDVTPIAVVTATITLVSSRYVVTSASYTDARRYIGNGYGGLEKPFILGNNGSFRTVESLVTWLDQLTNYNSYSANGYNSVGATVIVKDNMDISGETFNFGSKVKFIGDGGKFTVTTAVAMSDIHLENLNISTSVDSAITFSGTQNNMTQCYVSHATAAAVFPIVIAAASSVRFTDNVFTCSANPTAFISASASALKQILVGNVYKSGQVLIASGTFLPATITDLNANDGA